MDNFVYIIYHTRCVSKSIEPNRARRKNAIIINLIIPGQGRGSEKFVKFHKYNDLIIDSTILMVNSRAIIKFDRFLQQKTKSNPLIIPLDIESIE